MNIGALNKRITIQSPTLTSDGMGSQTTVWGDVAEVYAAIWPTSANEVVQANSSTMTITHRIRIRYRSGILASYRVKFGTRYFNIVSVLNPNEGNKMLDLMAKEASA